MSACSLPPKPKRQFTMENKEESKETPSKQGVKLTEKDVVALRNDHKNGSSMLALARKYGISEGIVGRIIHRKLWKHVL